MIGRTIYRRMLPVCGRCANAVMTRSADDLSHCTLNSYSEIASPCYSCREGIPEWIAVGNGVIRSATLEEQCKYYGGPIKIRMELLGSERREI